jgi:hypothetical protein
MDVGEGGSENVDNGGEDTPFEWKGTLPLS